MELALRGFDSLTVVPPLALAPQGGFMDTLVDGDVANNAGNWQWVAGTGNDPRPYRKFNPYRQAERYDPDGAYQWRWRSRRDR